MYNAYVVKIEHLRLHPNADRLQVATIFGEDTCVSLDVKLGDLGLYFPVDGQLSEEFCDQNHMCRKKADGTPDTGYMERESRKVKAIKLRGLKSNGIYCPLTSVEYTGVNLSDLTPGLVITALNGHEICCKYIPKRNPNAPRSGNGKNKSKTKKEDIAPLFKEHKDTEQLAYNLGAFKNGDQIEITLKMHGTSQRTGYLPVFKEYKHKYRLMQNLANTDINKVGKAVRDLVLRARSTATPVYDWNYVTGTRRTVLEGEEGGFYGSNAFRTPHAKAFEGKLWKGETVYYEVVGFTNSGTPIMPSASNKKLEDKNFITAYGPETVFSYGCNPEGEKLMHGNDDRGAFTIPVKVPQSDFYVYRMTMTNEDGDVVEYTPDFMRYRCEQMGVKTVPLLWCGSIPDDLGRFFDFNTGEEYEMTPGDWIKEEAETYYDGPDPIGKTHVREGVVVRIVNRPSFTAYKHKNWYFRALSGIAVEQLEKEKNIEELSDDILSEV